jgi:hypothetical protein
MKQGAGHVALGSLLQRNLAIQELKKGGTSGKGEVIFLM